ncbi:UDP-N-acetylmuramate:L-alanyl-gamma-D-glutamyl-meso-diaminopimelate ligase [candidate division KSB1 bacterium]|nr:UDP-N-acetylmuramate:L-alanyl-gamma-D-glutamyl-meso-diaminopimelate ligase [candidate division KSB1 bacterium]
MSKRIHLIAICGTGMAALAGMLKQRGYEITGSDTNVYPPMSTFLESMGIPVYNGFDAAHLEPAPDLVIIGNAMSRGNPEVEYVLNEQIPYASLPETLKNHFIRGKYSCVVAGTHGKTTTSSLLAWTLQSAGWEPSFFIGGIPENFGQGFQLGNGRHFVLEGDEYDSAFFDKGPKFLHYLPSLVILNNIEYDHADIYRSFEDVQISFRRLINLIPAKGFLIACSDDPAMRNMLKAAFCNVITFGVGEEAQWRVEEIRVVEGGTEFVVMRGQERLGPFLAPLEGMHNAKNATAVLAASEALGIPRERAVAALRTFKNVRRRMQLLFEQNGVRIFDDFAHHPTEIRETINSVRLRFPERRLWAVFEPRSATAKRKVFEQEYLHAFRGADNVVFAPVHRPDKVPEAERLSLSAVVDGLRSQGKSVEILPTGEQMTNHILSQLRKGDVVLFMSNGDFGGTPALLIQKLKTGTAPPH